MHFWHPKSDIDFAINWVGFEFALGSLQAELDTAIHQLGEQDEEVLQSVVSNAEYTTYEVTYAKIINIIFILASKVKVYIQPIIL